MNICWARKKWSRLYRYNDTVVEYSKYGVKNIQRITKKSIRRKTKMNKMNKITFTYEHEHTTTEYYLIKFNE